MGNMLEDGAAFLQRHRSASMSREVEYRRGSDSTRLLVSVGTSEYEQADDSGVVQRFAERDFLFAPEDLILSGGQTLPKVGDLIIDTIDGEAHGYEVRPPGGGGPSDPPFRYSDPYRRAIRCHTKSVGQQGGL